MMVCVGIIFQRSRAWVMASTWSSRAPLGKAADSCFRLAPRWRAAWVRLVGKRCQSCQSGRTWANLWRKGRRCVPIAGNGCVRTLYIRRRQVQSLLTCKLVRKQRLNLVGEGLQDVELPHLQLQCEPELRFRRYARKRRFGRFTQEPDAIR